MPKSQILACLALLLLAFPLHQSVVAQPADQSSTVIPAADATWFPDFKKVEDAVFSGQYIASDPSIVVEGNTYRLYYTCFIVPESGFVPENVRAGICSATSDDGMNWTEVNSGDTNTPGLVLRGIEGSWQENLEAAFVIKVEGTYLLYYSGYETEGTPALGFPAKLAVASSTDGIHFERVTEDPVLEPTPGWYDNDAVYSPAIAFAGDQLVMVYAGHCYTDCRAGWGVTLLGATSHDGLTWSKLDQPVLQGTTLGLDWTKDGVGEPALLYGADGTWHLFFTSLQDAKREIGIAAGPSPFGPWEVVDTPLLQPTPGTFDEGGVLAPFVLTESGALRMWYLGQSIGEEVFAIGYAEAPAPPGT